MLVQPAFSGAPGGPDCDHPVTDTILPEEPDLVTAASTGFDCWAVHAMSTAPRRIIDKRLMIIPRFRERLAQEQKQEGGHVDYFGFDRASDRRMGGEIKPDGGFIETGHLFRPDGRAVRIGGGIWRRGVTYRCSAGVPT
jgi:hypothetical protein